MDGMDMDEMDGMGSVNAGEGGKEKRGCLGGSVGCGGSDCAGGVCVRGGGCGAVSNAGGRCCDADADGGCGESGGIGGRSGRGDRAGAEEDAGGCGGDLERGAVDAVLLVCAGRAGFALRVVEVKAGAGETAGTVRADRWRTR
jgi:hypothetical protein